MSLLLDILWATLWWFGLGCLASFLHWVLRTGANGGR